MKHFKLYNNIGGWVAFIVAAITYLLTIEPTASFWDCGEFIASASKLEVGHPPGAPFFILTGRIFALFASDPTQIAACINSMSAIFSALTILFLFWTITHIVRKIVCKEKSEMTVAQGIATLGAGMVGALTYTFSDTFWFSAVEGEVYAYSSFFTAIVFWCILKWEDSREQSSATRWIILIAYLMGLSIGVHLLNLLTIPALVLVYYFASFKTTTKNTILALLISVIILAAVLYGMIPGFVEVASWFELFFVNVCGLSFNSGLLIYVICTLLILAWAIYATHKTEFGGNKKIAAIAFTSAIFVVGIPFIGSGTFSIILGILILAGVLALLISLKDKVNYKWLNTIVLCVTVMLIGYSSYTMIVVRSMANTPMDQNSPEDVFSLQSYLNREQYGDRPLFYGAMYSAPEQLVVKGNICEPVPRFSSTIWKQKEKESADEKDVYVNKGKRQIGYEMDPKFNMLFPRMYSSNPSHIEEYKNWANVKGKRIETNRCGRTEKIVMPTFGENLKFFFSYQVNFMYWRYFMWNFSGRQNDMQCHGELDKGNWISGIPFIDNARLGDQDLMPDTLKNNKGHNRYFMLPLLLGLLGIAWQLMNKRRGAEQFWIVFTLFFMTGIAIVIYLNQTPLQPRERDYAYAGSFYAFTIWIGLGVMFLYDILKKFSPKVLSAIIATLVSMGVPVLMAQQNWDDHDRSNRTLARDMGWNYLNSCEENAILFSNGDNDTFPLWYNQEVEENRTDVRVCNLSYLNTDWYVDQMKREAYKSAPLPISWERKDYLEGNLDVCRVNTNNKAFPLRGSLEVLRLKNIDENGIGTYPSNIVFLPIDKDQVIATHTVKDSDTSNICAQMNINLGRSVSKAQTMFLEMLSSNNWERPMYVCATVGREYYPAISNYLQLEGLAYRIVPTNYNRETVNTEKMYDNMMNKFLWGNVNDPKVYLDEQHLRMCRTLRMMFVQLADALVNEQQSEKALAVLAKAEEVLPYNCIPLDYSCATIADLYYKLGKKDKADALIDALFDDCKQRINWVANLKPSQRRAISGENGISNTLGILQSIYLSRTIEGINPEKREEAKRLFEMGLPYYNENR
ncbi:MAG: DUF2723 domain-containing protein [Bacteroidales bacterium]|nr:DUF2723 domain-containing protein [Bacteroidales bacterium]